LRGARTRQVTRKNDFAAADTIPLWLKVAYSAFLCVLVPVYWAQYGPTNFLWFSDIALFVTAIALWRENRFLASTQAVSVCLLELVWIGDFLIRLTTGVQIVGLSEYLFDPARPVFLRGLSLFHLVLPFLLLWLVWRLGYDRRAWAAQSVLALIVLPLCYFLTDPSDNINWVFGLGDQPQTLMPPGHYLALLMTLFPLAVYLPTHLVLRETFSERGESDRRTGRERSLD
jgi:hypothetical protein